MKTFLAAPLQYGANEAADLDDRTLPRFVRITDIDESGALRDETFRSLPRHLAQPYLLHDNDILLARSGGTVGKSFIYSTDWGEACFAGYLIRARLRRSVCTPKFLYYFCQTPEYWNYIDCSQIQATIQNVSAEKYANLHIPLPPSDEQKQIAAFLDYETAKIDALIEKQQQLIALLGEKRQAVISHAVTKGLNPDAPMRDSGIEWLGEVPEHWRLGPLKRFWPVVDCKHITVPFLDEGYPVVSVMEVRTFELDLSRVLLTDKANFELLKSGGREPKQGDVIYCRNTANTGTSAYVGTSEPICIGQDVVLIKSRTQNGRFLNYILHGPEMAGQLALYMVGSTFKRINVADIRELIVTCPPPPEQEKIVQHLDSKASQFDELIGNAVEMMEVLRERRVSLISAAVTGKIDVRGWKPPSSGAKQETEMEVA
ncbi:restriction endonuclease subunit S [Novipirellula galeiformis]|nr:restriction endonuclease subunit S [Novipirellula galeiformis]